jgi:tRNA (Thr-GGU) A37 N-methylase
MTGSGDQASARCSSCGAACDGPERFVVDGRTYCKGCLFGDVEPLCIHPIGTVRNDSQRDASDFGTSGGGRTSRIELHPGQEMFMYRLEDETRLTVVYHLHRPRPVRSRFRRGLDGKEVGVFASRTPDRLSHVGIQDVTLIEVRGTTLVVEGLDAIDGTPVLDIKLGR